MMTGRRGGGWERGVEEGKEDDEVVEEEGKYLPRRVAR